MVTDVLKVPGDYRIISRSGNITLDTPLTIVNGNLTVIGETTTVESVNAAIKDNIVILNFGESNMGPNGAVTLGTSGIMIARGFSNSTDYGAFFVFDDNFTLDGGIGSWNFGSSNNFGHHVKVKGIVTPQTHNTLTFLSSYNPFGVLSVAGTTDYENQVTHDDHIPNKKYVDSLIGTTEFAKKLIVGNSFVEINDNSVSTSSVYFTATNRIIFGLGTASNIVLNLTQNVAEFSELVIFGRTIEAKSTSTNADLILKPKGNAGTLYVLSNMKLENSVQPSAEAGYTGIFSTSTVGGGGTGVYFVNTTEADELVSRKRSIIYSLIF